MLLKVKPYVHAILTRFNVFNPGMNVRDPQNRLNLDWLDHRFKLFEEFCYPTVKEQTNQNFRWFVFFDEKTPKSYHSQIDKYRCWPNFIPVFLKVFDPESVCEILLSNIDSKPDYLITTLLDNDDAIHRHFVQSIQEAFTKFLKNGYDGKTPRFLNFTYGYVFDRIGNRLYAVRHWGNPFISMIEKFHEIETVYVRNHDELYLINPVEQVKSLRAWMQVVHEMNALNTVYGIRVPLKKIEIGFSAIYGDIIANETKIELWIDKAFTILRAIVKAILKRLNHLGFE